MDVEIGNEAALVSQCIKEMEMDLFFQKRGIVFISALSIHLLLLASVSRILFVRTWVTFFFSYHTDSKYEDKYFHLYLFLYTICII
jgi:hypothetical protein